jgi:hypothetical protein
LLLLLLRLLSILLAENPSCKGGKNGAVGQEGAVSALFSFHFYATQNHKFQEET